MSNQEEGEEWDNQEVQNLDPQAYLQNLTDELEQPAQNDDLDALDNEEYHHTVQQVCCPLGHHQRYNQRMC